MSSKNIEEKFEIYDLYFKNLITYMWLNGAESLKGQEEKILEKIKDYEVKFSGHEKYTAVKPIFIKYKLKQLE